MKEFWKCQWESIPGDGEQEALFPTLAEAKQAMRKIIAGKMDLTEYLSDLEPQVAEFLGKYLSDPQFPQSKCDIPKEYDDPDDGELMLDSNHISWEYVCDAAPKLHTNLVLDDIYNAHYYFNFWYDAPKKAAGNGVKELVIRIDSVVDYGTSAYPLLVLLALREYPQNQGRLLRTIKEIWGTVLDRKAVGRHLQLLVDMGYPVQHGPEGYWYEGQRQAPKDGMCFTPNVYPLLILEVLDGIPQSQTAIAQAVLEQYGIKIDRKAIKRHLDLLGELGFRIKKSKAGYACKFD